jgi:osmoprotectant transport system ATP-binding protein
MAEPPDMIVLDRVSMTYDGVKQIVKEVSLTVPKGKMLALLGRAGCGKTTTLKMINRLVEPTSGSVRVDGRDVRTVDPVELRRSIGYVIQGSGLFPHMTAADNIAVVPRLLGWPRERIAKRVDELMTMVQLPPEEFRGRLPRQLSGGQQQRVGLARALASGSQVLLMDEPFGALDPVTRRTLRTEFLELRRRLGLTAVMVTHDMAEALLSADLIAVMDRGELLEVGTPHKMLTEAGHPFVKEIFAIPKDEADRLEDLAAGENGREEGEEK